MKLPFRPNRVSKAFTLGEVLSVIAIIGILASFVLPITARLRAEGERAKCAANMRQYLTALSLFVANNNGKLPECVHTSQKTVEVRIQLAPYLAAPGDLTDHELFLWAGKITCASSAKTTKGRSWSFGFNSWTSKLPMQGITTPGSLIYMMEATGSRAIRPETFTGLPDDFRQAIPRPHNGKINAGFLDGHIEARKASSLTWADFTKGTPSYVPSYDTRMVTTAQYDK